MNQLRMLSAALILFVLSGCNKLVDHIKDHLDDDDKTYRIETWTRQDPIGYYYYGKFTYNKHNDPISLVWEGTGGIEWKMNYDKHNRLSETYRYEDNEYHARWYTQYRKYKHNNKGQIISDTTYEYGEWAVTPTPENTYYWVTTYTYDQHGRIVKVEERHPQQTPEDPLFINTYEYAYDANGNLVRPGYTYDNKLNLFRTNKLFMFLSRDYSVNNPFTATSYNSAGLPLGFSDNAPRPYPQPYFLYDYLDNSTFTYKKIK